MTSFLSSSPRGESSTTTRLRVVFNGSQKTDTGTSLNECLLSWPNLLPEIFDILVRWRLLKIAFSADISKMYRQIRVHKDDCDLQRILWRETNTGELKHFRLLTVTYGLTCAPFLAIRTLRQLASDERERYPLGAISLKQDFYVDDVLSGAESQKQAIQLQTQLRQLLKAGGFDLCKWASNSTSLTNHLPEDERADSKTVLPNGTTSRLNLLGLSWESTNDVFHFSIPEGIGETTLTKRGILSSVARLFDSLGWLSPAIIKAKVLL